MSKSGKKVEHNSAGNIKQGYYSMKLYQCGLKSEELEG